MSILETGSDCTEHHYRATQLSFELVPRKCRQMNQNSVAFRDPGLEDELQDIIKARAKEEGVLGDPMMPRERRRSAADLRSG